MTEPPPSRQTAPPWGEHPLPRGDEVRTVEIGPLTLWIRRHADEVWLAHRSGSGASGAGDDGASQPPPDEADWTRWPVPEGTDRIVLNPAFPDRPVVVEPDLSFRLIKGARARIYVRVPLWAKVQLPGKDEVTLREVPTLTLSDTWWGDLSEGELCYWLATQARRRLGPEDFEPHLALCPLQLANRSDDDLNVERLAVRVAHLTIFAHQGRLWADDTRVRYRGEVEGSEIDMSGKPPEEAPDAVRLARPRAPEPRGFTARTFARLRALPGLGGSF